MAEALLLVSLELEGKHVEAIAKHIARKTREAFVRELGEEADPAYLEIIDSYANDFCLEASKMTFVVSADSRLGDDSPFDIGSIVALDGKGETTYAKTFYGKPDGNFDELPF